MAGLTKLKSFPFEHMMSKNDFDYDILIYQLLLEAQSPRLVSEVFTNKTSDYIFLWSLSSVDFCALAYCIVNPLTPNDAIWRHTYFRQHNFMKKC